MRTLPKELTKLQQDVLDCVLLHFEAYGFSPTCVEISEELCESRSSVWEALQYLIRKGHLSKSKKWSHRNLVLEDHVK